ASTPRHGTRSGGARRWIPRQFGDPEWVAAGKLARGHYWASPTEFGDAEPPPVRRRGVVFDADFWWVVGRWLGDGHLRTPRGEVQINCGYHEAEDLAKRLGSLAPPTGPRSQARELRWSRRDKRTAVLFTTAHI